MADRSDTGFDRSIQSHSKYTDKYEHLYNNMECFLTYGSRSFLPSRSEIGVRASIRRNSFLGRMVITFRVFSDVGVASAFPHEVTGPPEGLLHSVIDTGHVSVVVPRIRERLRLSPPVELERPHWAPTGEQLPPVPASRQARLGLDSTSTRTVSRTRFAENRRRNSLTIKERSAKRWRREGVPSRHSLLS